jgi:drug/metabolite transporter (DMT)-like permease
MSTYRRNAYTTLFISSLIWGVAAPVIKFTLQGIDVIPFLTYRFIVAGLFSLPFVLFTKLKIPNKSRNLPFVLLYGLLAFTIALGFLFLGLKQSGVLDLTLITIISPLLAVAGGAIVFKDHITKREKTGISLALIGVITVTLLPLLGGEDGVHFSGNIALLTFLVIDVVGILIGKKLLKKGVEPSALTHWGFVISAVAVTPFAIAVYGAEPLWQAIATLKLEYHLGVWYMALVSGTLAYYLYARGQRTIEVSEAALFKYLQPIFAVPLAMLWLGEKFTPLFILGAAIIAFGIFVAESKRQKLIKR